MGQNSSVTALLLYCNGGLNKPQTGAVQYLSLHQSPIIHILQYSNNFERNLHSQYQTARHSIEGTFQYSYFVLYVIGQVTSSPHLYSPSPATFPVSFVAYPRPRRRHSHQVVSAKRHAPAHHVQRAGSRAGALSGGPSSQPPAERGLRPRGARLLEGRAGRAARLERAAGRVARRHFRSLRKP